MFCWKISNEWTYVQLSGWNYRIPFRHHMQYFYCSFRFKIKPLNVWVPVKSNNNFLISSPFNRYMLSFNHTVFIKKKLCIHRGIKTNIDSKLFWGVSFGKLKMSLFPIKVFPNDFCVFIYLLWIFMCSSDMFALFVQS